MGDALIRELARWAVETGWASAKSRLKSMPLVTTAQGSRPVPGTRREYYGQTGLYLTRYTLGRLWGRRCEVLEHTTEVLVHMHCFHRGDEDTAVHSHPWRWALALVLAGGYHEERLCADGTVWRTLAPGALNVLRDDTFHRAELIGDESWSLIVTGPVVGSWSFLFPSALVPWRAFLDRKFNNAGAPT